MFNEKNSLKFITIQEGKIVFVNSARIKTKIPLLASD